MGCEVCLSEERKGERYVLRTFDLPPEEIERRLGGIPFGRIDSLSGVDLLFSREDDLEEASRRLGDAVYANSWRSMEEVVGDLLREKGYTLSTAESCTGGLLSARIVNAPGSSLYFVGGVVAYSNELKVRLLGVGEETLSRFGAVSEPTCREMLRGLRDRFGTEAGLAITGIAGPGGSGEKPEGLTYIGVYVRERVTVEERIFRAGRNPNRFLSSQVALNVLRKLLSEEVS